MKKFIHRFLIFGILIFQYSCISNKKYEEAVAVINTEHQTVLSKVQMNYTVEQEKNKQLELKLREEVGVNRALAGMQLVYMKDLDSLQNVIVKMGSSAQSTHKNLSQDLLERDKIIEEKENIILSVKNVITKSDADLDSLAAEILTTLNKFESTEFSVDKVDGKVRVQLFEELMFRSGNLRVRTKGGEALSKIATILNQNPALFFEIRGNTDNKTVRNYKDNWDFAAQRAAAVVRVLTDEFEVSPNQIILSSKGEFAPRTSNSTEEGRAFNRRIEIFIEKRTKDILRDIQKEMK